MIKRQPAREVGVAVMQGEWGLVAHPLKESWREPACEEENMRGECGKILFFPGTFHYLPGTARSVEQNGKNVRGECGIFFISLHGKESVERSSHSHSPGRAFVVSKITYDTH